MSETATPTSVRVPTVYLIDDSATMREVIKRAFHLEKFHAIICPDAASAMAQFGEDAPDAVISDVIMPDKDGYEVCQFIKQHEQFGRTPVILMSGIVNRTVAEKATAVKADELIRKPFQPQDLIARLKNLLSPGPAILPVENSTVEVPVPPRTNGTASRSARGGSRGKSQRDSEPVAAPAISETQKMRNEVLRLELLVQKLQAELDAEHRYCTALEAQFKAAQESE